MNIGYEDDELKPFIEPPPDINEPMRIGNDSSIIATTQPLRSCFILLSADLLPTIFTSSVA